MSSYAATVERAAPAQTGLHRRSEHCSGDPDLLATIDRAIGHQVRVVRSSTERALYTLAATEGEPGTLEPIVRMGDGGLARLSTTQAFTGTVEAAVTHPTFSDEQAEANGEFVERLVDNGINRGLIVLAPHGGEIERRTDEQAACVVARLHLKAVSGWWCRGYSIGPGAFRRWHITSTDLHEASFPRLAEVIGRPFRHAVSFHGFSDDEIEHDVLLGGIAPDALKQELVQAIERAVPGLAVHITAPGEQNGGDSRRNIVNRLAATGAGIQIEQQPRVRDDHARAVANAVADVYAGKLESFAGCRGVDRLSFYRCIASTIKNRPSPCPLD